MIPHAAGSLLAVSLSNVRMGAIQEQVPILPAIESEAHLFEVGFGHPRPEGFATSKWEVMLCHQIKTGRR
jgi:hypothetical protein